MSIKPNNTSVPNTIEFENAPLIRETGFREYDVRWFMGKDLNLLGVQSVGMAIGTLLGEMGKPKKVVTGHDFRHYSLSVKLALMQGLMAAGCDVVDIGLALSPMAYFAQFELDVPAVAMVTASHNENGWTGIKMGCNRPVTFGPEEITRLKEIIFNASYDLSKGGTYTQVENFRDVYLADLLKRPKLTRKLKVVVACGNGTAGAFAPQVFEALGCEVIPMDVSLDYTFPRYNPNPEDMEMLHEMARVVKETGADLALGFDGDGDRCGVVDNNGHEIFADKIGVLLARDLAKQNPGAKFVVDVKSTGIYQIDPELKASGAVVDYWKTGHSYIKRRVSETGALAGFEKSGHFFFNQPVGRGYDDGILAGIIVCQMLNNNPGKKLSELVDSLPKTWSSPTMSPHCGDEVKYGVVDRVTAHFESLHKNGGEFAGSKIQSLMTVNGVRVTVGDGSWALVRASSNKPELVIVVESPVSDARMREMFAAMDGVLQGYSEVGEYNQKL